LLARLTRVPVLSSLVRRVANIYGKSRHVANFLTLDQAEQIIDASNNVALGPCSCRQVFHNCNLPILTEIVVGAGVEVFSKIRPDEFHEISKEEAKKVLHDCHLKHVMHTIMRCQKDFYAICNCCTCCCVPTRLKQDYGIEYALVKNKNVVEDFRRQQ
jgi:hypothetical protein